MQVLRIPGVGEILRTEDLPSDTPAYPRRQAAILHADVKNYSGLMADDADSTVRDLERARALVTTVIESHGGRLVDTAGDGFLAEFPGPVAAVSCARRFQKEMFTRNAQMQPSRRMVFRLGITLGTVLYLGDRIFGDCVNLAARLEKVAPAGGICMSGQVYDAVKDELPWTYQLLGSRRLKSFPEPVTLYTLMTEPALCDEAGCSSKTKCFPGRILQRLLPAGLAAATATAGDK